MLTATYKNAGILAFFVFLSVCAAAKATGAHCGPERMVVVRARLAAASVTTTAEPADVAQGIGLKVTLAWKSEGNASSPKDLRSQTDKHL